MAILFQTAPLAAKATNTPDMTGVADEQRLLAACLRSERWAHQRLYEMHYGKLMAVCLRYCNDRDDALDILHEGFIKVYTNLHKYQPGTSLFAWMRRIMVTTSIDYYRKHLRHYTEDLDNARDLSDDDADVISQSSEQDILDSIQMLPPAYRTVFNLYAIEGYSHKEIADLLGIAESTSRSNLVKARTKLQAMLTHLEPSLQVPSENSLYEA